MARADTGRPIDGGRGTAAGRGAEPRARSRRLALGQRLGTLLTLERADDRLTLTLSLVIAALVSPNIALPQPLPAVRAEQVLLVLILPPLAGYHLRHRELLRPRATDIAFALMVVATTVTVVFAPLLVEGVSRSWRDLFEVVRVVEYFVVFRLAMTLAPFDISAAALLRALAIASVPIGVLAVLQYLDLAFVNQVLTPIWTDGHNLAGVEREGRAVGTAGNANQFGILASLFALALLAVLAFEIVPYRPWAVAAALSVAATFASQSRGAVAALAAGLAIGVIVMMVRRVGWARFGRSAAPVAVGVVVAVVLMTAFPPASGTFLSRFDVAKLLRDPSLIIRLGRLQSLFASPDDPVPGETPVQACVERLLPAEPQPGHERGRASLPVQSPEQVRAVREAAVGVAQYYCSGEEWPPPSLAAIGPPHLPRQPVDPVTSRSLEGYFSEHGFVVSVPSAEAVAGPAMGSIRNLVDNASFELGDSQPSAWLWTTRADVRLLDRGAPYGERLLEADLEAGEAVYHLAVAEIPAETQLTFAAWAAGRGDVEQSVQLYVVGVTSDGRRMDPLAQRTFRLAPEASGWSHLSLPFSAPADPLSSLQIMVRAPEGPAQLRLDGVTLTEGPLVPGFEYVVDEPGRSVASGPGFRDSPWIGVGPQKEAGIGPFDNEFAAVLHRYGLLGFGAYLLLFLGAATTAILAMRRHRSWAGTLAVGVLAFTVALLVFAVTAGAFRQLQVMVLYWLLLGVVAGALASGQGGGTAPTSDPVRRP